MGPCGSNGSARGIHFEEFAEDLQFTLFPNPAHDLVSLEIANPTSAAYTLTIMGMDGRTIETVVVNASEGSARVQQSISLQALSPGLYFINVTSGKQTLSQMVVKE
ncbi:MAG TPA: hypothetical protein DCR93_24390 [Cytophagales bacterium]|nr:hypothetical protein [Cytophagales bacterium]